MKAQTSLNAQSHSKKCGIYRCGNVVQYSGSVVLISTTFIHNCYLNNIKVLRLAYQFSCFLFVRKLNSHVNSIFCIFVYFDKKQGTRLLIF